MHWLSKQVALLGAVALSGCATVVPPAKILPPVELLQDCAEPAQGFKTNGEMAEYLLDLRSALRGCNVDKQALRVWANPLEGNPHVRH
jgi:hypothetical protein